MLYQAEMQQSKDPLLVERYLDQLIAQPEEKEYAGQLALGTMTHQQEIEDLLVQNMEKWKLFRLSALARNLLRLATYEMCFVEMASYKIVIDEAMEIAKSYIEESAHGFVNSVLQKVYDNHFQIKVPPLSAPQMPSPSVPGDATVVLSEIPEPAPKTKRIRAKRRSEEPEDAGYP